MHALLLLDIHHHKEVNKRNSLPLCPCQYLYSPSTSSLFALKHRRQQPSRRLVPAMATTWGSQRKLLRPPAREHTLPRRLEALHPSWSQRVEATLRLLRVCEQRETRGRHRQRSCRDRTGNFFLGGRKPAGRSPVAVRLVAVWRSSRGLSSETQVGS